jgi:carbonic anhydrase/acetyltransferase-like protein (isoleucine patch superfamily)
MQKKRPTIHPSTYIDDSAVIIGNVTIGKNCGIYPNAVIRGDENSITIEDGSNIQDCCIIHVDESNSVSIGKQVSIGHGSIVHGATIEDKCIIGMHATILNEVIIRKGSIIGAQAVVTSGTIIPENSLVLGIPGKIVNNDKSYQKIATNNAKTYINLSSQYLKNQFQRYSKSNINID